MRSARPGHPRSAHRGDARPHGTGLLRTVLAGACLALGYGGDGRVPLDGLPATRRASSLFDPALALGRPDANERADALDVPAHFRELATRARFGDADPELVVLGDALAFLRSPDVDARLAELARRAPGLAHETGWFLPELLHDASFRRASWRGRRDPPDDGFLSLRGWWPWYGYYRERWPDFDAEACPQAYQVVTLVLHDLPAAARPRDAAEALACVRAAARDFAGARAWRGLSLRIQDVALVPETLWVAPAGDALSYAVRYALAGLPPFVVQVRERMDGAVLVVDHACVDGPWSFFAGREEYVPVHDSRGGFVCLLAIGTFAVAEVHGDILLRESLGNVRERAARIAMTAAAR